MRTDRSDMVGQGSLGMLSLGCIRSHEIWQFGIGAEGCEKVRRIMVRQSRQIPVGKDPVGSGVAWQFRWR